VIGCRGGIYSLLKFYPIVKEDYGVQSNSGVEIMGFDENINNKNFFIVYSCIFGEL
jgi:hypothetical protein